MLNYCANGPSGYNLTNSLRFRSSASAYLNRTPASAGNRQIFTLSTWVKRGTFPTGNGYKLFSAYNGDSDSGWFDLRFHGDNTLMMVTWNWTFYTSAVFRDPSAWYHVVLAVDTTQATAANRIKIYVNGVQYTLSGSTATQNTNLAWNNSIPSNIGRHVYNSSDFYDGYMTEIYNIDGQALTPSSFGSTNSTTGVWQPKQYTGTYGTNGFYLPFGSSYFGLPISATSGPGFSTYAGSFVNGISGTQVNLPANATNLAIGTGDFTVEGWVNTTTNGRGSLIGIGTVNSAGSFWFGWESNTDSYIRFGATDVITTGLTLSSAGWVHIAVTRSGSTVRLYKNGSLVASGTSSTNLNLTDISAIGGYGASTPNSYTLQGSISNLRLVVGTALYTGSTYTVPTSALTAVSGTQLLTLQNATLKDNSTNNYSMTAVNPYALDASGNSNSWQMVNINVTTVGTTYDSMTDVPTLTSATVANYAVLNRIYTNTQGVGTLSNANLRFTFTNLSTETMVGTFGASTGKWYWEFIASANPVFVGIRQVNTTDRFSNSILWGGSSISATGDKWVNGTSSAYAGASWTTGDVIGVAVDMDGGTVTFYKNNTSQGSINLSLATITDFVPAFNNGASTAFAGDVNFGQRPFSYTPPTGFVALNTYNLPTPTILQGNKYMDATLYTGNGSTQTIVNQGQFQPDFVWIKSRSGTWWHILEDSVRGAGKYLYSNNTNAEGGSTNNGYITTFNSNGFGVNLLPNESANNTSDTYVGWQWQAGQGTTSSNTSGSVTSTVSVNTSAGFSVCTFTTPSASHSNFTFGHGLGVAPKMVIVKSRSAATDWNVYHVGMGATKGMYLNQTLGAQTSTGFWQDTTPSSTLVYIGTGFAGSSETAVAYCWAEIAGFSKFGSYTGNGSADGPFIYLGFRPKYIMRKATSAIGDWIIFDTSIDPYNLSQTRLLANTSNGEQVNGNNIDILSNGWKERNNDGYSNNNGTTYIYFAFAENPFKNALAR